MTVKHKKIAFLAGFSLMEVMVALAILAISFTALFLVQARSTNIAMSGRNISIATQLARFQLMECKREAKKKISSVTDLSLEGDFSELGYEKFRWECHAPRFNMKAPPEKAIKKSIEEQTPEQNKKDIKDSSGISSSMMGIITDSLGDSVRELVVIVRWTDNNIEDELRVVTHVIDTSAMARLSVMISQGSSFVNKKDDKEEKPKEQMPPAPPQQRQGPFPDFRAPHD